MRFALTLRACGTFNEEARFSEVELYAERLSRNRGMRSVQHSSPQISHFGRKIDVLLFVDNICQPRQFVDKTCRLPSSDSLQLAFSHPSHPPRSPRTFLTLSLSLSLSLSVCISVSVSVSVSVPVSVSVSHSLSVSRHRKYGVHPVGTNPKNVSFHFGEKDALEDPYQSSAGVTLAKRD